MAELDTILVALMDAGEITDPVRLYDTSAEAQGLVERSEDLASDIVFTAAPPALTGLASQVEMTALSYLEAARAMSQWIGAPSPDTEHTALEALRLARSQRQELGTNQWLMTAE
jgi:hypothetical protein